MTDPRRDPVVHHTEWRGPRRLNAVYTTSPSWTQTQEEPAEGKRLARRRTPLHGEIHLGIGETTFHGRFSDPIGSLVRRQKKNGDWTRDNETSTERAQLVPLIDHVSASGPVLVVQPTRTEAQRLAEEVADVVEDDDQNTALVELARARLTDNHPLISMIRKGVAFHHAALPMDIQIEIENAVRAGRIRILVSTSTLIEGVNLPFKTVIVGRRGYNDSNQGYVETIGASGLLNAVGRAGRAGRETEGWLILAELSADYSPSMFEPLNRTGDDLDLRSMLTTESALAGLRAYEEASRTAEDAIFHQYDSAADGFLSFIWFAAQSLRDIYQVEASEEDIHAVIERTLAWQQLDAEQTDQLARSAVTALRAFDQHSAQQRARWARSGATLRVSRALDTLAESLFDRLQGAESIEPDDLANVLDFILVDDTLEQLLGMQDRYQPRFKPYRTAPRDARIAVDIKALLLDWVRGMDVQELADSYLAAIEDEAFRSESISEFTANVFEHHLPWALGLLLQWVNERLAAVDNPLQLPVALLAAIHYGVSSESALSLMIDGVRSRRLANVVADMAPQALGDESQSLRAWLVAQTLDEWREAFSASPTELADLLAFARAPGAQAVNLVLEGSIHEFSIHAIGDNEITDSTDATITLEQGVQEPSSLQVETAGGIVGTVGPSDYDDISLLIRMGVPLDIRVRRGFDEVVLSIALAADPGP